MRLAIALPFAWTLAWYKKQAELRMQDRARKTNDTYNEIGLLATELFLEAIYRATNPPPV
jgi:hypothetical protein